MATAVLCSISFLWAVKKQVGFFLLLEEVSFTLPVKYILHCCLLASEFKKMTARDTCWWLGWQLLQPCLSPDCPEERLGMLGFDFLHGSCCLLTLCPTGFPNWGLCRCLCMIQALNQTICLSCLDKERHFESCLILLLEQTSVGVK